MAERKLRTRLDTIEAGLATVLKDLGDVKDKPDRNTEVVDRLETIQESLQTALEGLTDAKKETKKAETQIFPVRDGLGLFDLIFGTVSADRESSGGGNS